MEEAPRPVVEILGHFSVIAKNIIPLLSTISTQYSIVSPSGTPCPLNLTRHPGDECLFESRPSSGDAGEHRDRFLTSDDIVRRKELTGGVASHYTSHALYKTDSSPVLCSVPWVSAALSSRRGAMIQSTFNTPGEYPEAYRLLTLASHALIMGKYATTSDGDPWPTCRENILPL